MNVSVTPTTLSEDERHDTPAATSSRGPESAAKELHSRSLYRCAACGHELRVFGGGRHRIYFPVENLRLDDPIMTHCCPDCGRSLPSTDSD
jgi:predicted RNA-binding Zn-ribbon protein involved in translation (DUF1610 family)